VILACGVMKTCVDLRTNYNDMQAGGFNRIFILLPIILAPTKNRLELKHVLVQCIFILFFVRFYRTRY